MPSASAKKPQPKRKAPPASGQEQPCKKQEHSAPSQQQPCKKQQPCVSRALASVVADAYLQADADLAGLMRSVQVKPRQKGSPRNYATWKPADSVFFTLIKTKANTVAFCHATGQPYHAAPQARLADGCPERTAFLCQFCMDNGKVPRLLVFDLVESCEDVQARGQHLRELARFLPQPLCTVQWTGEPEALEGFTAKLPHKVDCIVGLGSDPLRLERYMRVALPPGMPGAATFEGFLVH